MTTTEIFSSTPLKPDVNIDYSNLVFVLYYPPSSSSSFSTTYGGGDDNVFLIPNF